MAKRVATVSHPGCHTLLSGSLSEDFLLLSCGPASPWASYSLSLDFKSCYKMEVLSLPPTHLTELSETGWRGVFVPGVYVKENNLNGTI